MQWYATRLPDSQEEELSPISAAWCRREEDEGAEGARRSRQGQIKVLSSSSICAAGQLALKLSSAAPNQNPGSAPRGGSTGSPADFENSNFRSRPSFSSDRRLARCPQRDQVVRPPARVPFGDSPSAGSSRRPRSRVHLPRLPSLVRHLRSTSTGLLLRPCSPRSTRSARRARSLAPGQSGREPTPP